MQVCCRDAVAYLIIKSIDAMCPSLLGTFVHDGSVRAFEVAYAFCSGVSGCACVLISSPLLVSFLRMSASSRTLTALPNTGQCLGFPMAVRCPFPAKKRARRSSEAESRSDARSGQGAAASQSTGHTENGDGGSFPPIAQHEGHSAEDRRAVTCKVCGGAYETGAKSEAKPEAKPGVEAGLPLAETATVSVQF